MKEKKFYSQFGEDSVLLEIFQQKTTGICVEVGANNGVDDSTSLFFEKMGWKCILVEPNPSLCREIRRTRKGPVYECAASQSNGITTLNVTGGAERSHGLSTISMNKETQERIKKLGFTVDPVQVPVMTLDSILMDAGVNGAIDFITIDVEGHELEALKGFSLPKWAPAILIVEDNSNFENGAVSHYLRKFDYTRFLRTGVNDWYAPRTNHRLVNFASRTRILWTALKARIRNRHLRIPFAARIRPWLRQLGNK